MELFIRQLEPASFLGISSLLYGYGETCWYRSRLVPFCTSILLIWRITAYTLQLVCCLTCYFTRRKRKCDTQWSCESSVYCWYISCMQPLLNSFTLSINWVEIFLVLVQFHWAVGEEGSGLTNHSCHTVVHTAFPANLVYCIYCNGSCGTVVDWLSFLQTLL